MFRLKAKNYVKILRRNAEGLYLHSWQKTGPVNRALNMLIVSSTEE